MDISFHCESCGQDIVIEEAGAGLQIQCPNCGVSVQVPQLTTESPSSPERGDPDARTRNQNEIQRLHATIDDAENAIAKLKETRAFGVSLETWIPNISPYYWKIENMFYAGVISSFVKTMTKSLAYFRPGDERASRIDSILKKWTLLSESRLVTQADYFDFVDDLRALPQDNPSFLKPEVENFDTPLDVLAEIESILDRDSIERRLAKLRTKIFHDVKREETQP